VAKATASIRTRHWSRLNTKHLPRIVVAKTRRRKESLNGTGQLNRIFRADLCTFAAEVKHETYPRLFLPFRRELLARLMIPFESWSRTWTSHRAGERPNGLSSAWRSPRRGGRRAGSGRTRDRLRPGAVHDGTVVGKRSRTSERWRNCARHPARRRAVYRACAGDSASGRCRVKWCLTGCVPDAQ